MVKQIVRSGVWETNSSSAHSISIGDGSLPFIFDPIIPDDFGVIDINGGEYGRDWYRTNNSLDKANYIAQYYMFNKEMLSMVAEAISDICAAKVVFHLDDGYVDHQAEHKEINNIEFLKNFIFNRNSWLFCGSDEETPPNGFYDTPQYTHRGVKYPRYRYKVKIDGLEKPIYYRRKPTRSMLIDDLSSLLYNFIWYNGKFIDRYQFEVQNLRLDPPNKRKGFIIPNWFVEEYFLVMSRRVIRLVSSNWIYNIYRSEGDKYETAKKLLYDKNNPDVMEIHFAIELNNEIYFYDEQS